MEYLNQLWVEEELVLINRAPANFIFITVSDIDLKFLADCQVWILLGQHWPEMMTFFCVLKMPLVKIMNLTVNI